jgi:DNA mismatch repair protein MutL
MNTEEIQSRIQILDENTANQIAAGEVIERPASVVKELVENAIDAGALQVTIELEGAGRDLICISDDGGGMNQADILIALQRHATSKIRSASDLFEIRTMGFRGEALPSIASVSEITIISRPQDAAPDEPGACIAGRGGVVETVEEAGARCGTSIRVANLFYNVPARLKFLKTASTELGHISDMVHRFALAQPQIAFRLIHEGREIFAGGGSGSLIESAAAVFGRDQAKHLVPMDFTRGGVRVAGLIGNQNTLRNNRAAQHTFVNKRFVRDRAITRAIDDGYRSVQTIHGVKHPIAVLNVEIDPSLIDVNVSPTKTEVRFTAERDVFSAVYHAVANALVSEGGLVGQADFSSHPSPPIFKPEKPSAAFMPLFDAPSALPATTRQFEPPRSFSREYAPSEPTAQQREEFRDAVLERAGIAPAPVQNAEADPFGDEQPIEHPDLRSDAPSPSPHKDKLASLHVLAQTRNMYIIAQTNTALVIIDQHIAHERVLYEQLLSGRASAMLTMQHLIFPISLELGKKESLVVKARLGELQKAGFLLEEFGGDSFVVRAVPAQVAQGTRAESMVREVIDELVEKTTSRKMLVPAEEVLITASCKMAVKAGDPLSFDEMNALIADLLKCENPYTCPHGRPIIVEMSNGDLDRRFGR